MERRASEADCNAKKVEEKRNSKVKALIFTHLLYRHWNAYKEGKRTHLFVIAVDGCTTTDHVGAAALTRPAERSSAVSGEQGSPARAGAPIRLLPVSQSFKASSGPTQAEEGQGLCSIARDLTPGDYDAPVFSLGGQDDYAFSPDGQEICYASNHDPVPAISTNNDLFTVPVNFPADATSKDVVAATKDITADNKAADNTPLYSPDGKYIAYRAQQRPGYESDRWRLMLYDRKTNEKKTLTEDFDFWVGSHVWETDSKTIDFSAENAGSSPIYSVSLSGGLMGLARGYNDDLTVTPDGRQILLTKMSVQAPIEIYKASTAKYTSVNCISQAGLKNPLLNCFQDPQSVSHANDSVLSQVSMSPLEILLVHRRAGRQSPRLANQASQL